jgi:RNA polymerase sigma-70 factor, ECF subfamily
MYRQDLPQDEEAHAEARALMARVQQRDEAAFRELYDSHCDLVYSVAANLLPQGRVAEEVMQEVFLKIWNASGLYDPGLGKVVSWIITITRNLCLNRIRSETRRTAAHQKSANEIELNSPPPAADGMLLRNEDVLAVRAALALLPQDQQEAITLAFLHDMTHENAAAALDVPLGTLKARIRRGLLRLREHLAEIP